MDKIFNALECDYIKRQSLITKLNEEYPFIKRFSIGKSCGGKDITALKIGTAEDYSLIVAGVHGSERITSAVLLMYIEELCSALKSGGYIAGFEAKRALWGRGVIFVPCVNPDGCDISLLGEAACGDIGKYLGRLCGGDFTHWNANLRGVDINHNFSAGWEALRSLERENGIYGPSPTKFGGYKPESEPETKALVDLCCRINIRHATALHSQGEVVYWSYGNNCPDKARKMAEIMVTSSGYALDVPTGLAVGGGFKDWFIEEFCRPGFTVEIGMGENPLPITDADQILKRIKEMLTLCVIM